MNRMAIWCVPRVLGAAALAALVPVAAAQPVTSQFDGDTPVAPGLGWVIPADCSVWHELYPTWCVAHHQEGYDDSDGDGVVSVCDNIIEAGWCWHIESVTTTYFFSPVSGGGQSAGEPVDPNPEPSPVCEMWHIVYADGPPFAYCQSVHIEGWEDNNGSGTLDACDNIQIGGAWYHIDRVGCDVTVTGDPATGTDQGTWGWLKSLFRR